MSHWLSRHCDGRSARAQLPQVRPPGVRLGGAWCRCCWPCVARARWGRPQPLGVRRATLAGLVGRARLLHGHGVLDQRCAGAVRRPAHAGRGPGDAAPGRLPRALPGGRRRRDREVRGRLRRPRPGAGARGVGRHGVHARRVLRGLSLGAPGQQPGGGAAGRAAGQRGRRLRAVGAGRRGQRGRAGGVSGERPDAVDHRGRRGARPCGGRAAGVRGASRAARCWSRHRRCAWGSCRPTSRRPTSGIRARPGASSRPTWRCRATP